MTIILYNYSGEKNRINKTFGNSKELTGKLREECDVMNPSIIIKAPINQVCGFNYAYIPDFKRWYFITNCNSYRNDLTMITLSVDVLFTFKESILLSHATVIRSSRPYDAEHALPDDRYPILQSETTHTITFDTLYDNVADPSNPKGQTMVLVMTGIDVAS